MNAITFDQLPNAVTQIFAKLEQIEGLITAKSAPVSIEQDQLLTIKQAADFLHLTVTTLYGKVHRQELPYSKQGNRLYFSKSELTEWVKSGRVKTQAEIAQEATNYLTSKKKQHETK